MVDEVSYRFYQPSDYGQMRNLLHECGLFYEPMDTPERLEAKTTRDPHSVFVALNGDKIIGTVSIVEDGRMPFVFRLGVAKHFRKRGIGSALMEKAEDELSSRGYSDVNILVDEEEPELQSYYEKRGYEKGHAYRFMTKER